MKYINHKHQNCHQTFKFDPSNYLKLGGESNMSKFGRKWELPEKQFLDYFVWYGCFLAGLFKSKA